MAIAKAIQQEKPKKLEKEPVVVQQNVENNAKQDLIGRLAYCYCEGCKEGRVHRVKFNFTECIGCGLKITLLKGESQEEERKERKKLNDILIL